MKLFVRSLALFFLSHIISSCKEDIPMPEADFSLAINKAEVSFTNLSDNADSYVWNFGDGAGSNEQSPTHIYKTPGNYTVSLKATGAGGESSKQQSLIIQKANTKAAFSYKLQDAGNVQFINESLEAESFTWKIPELAISFISKDTTIKFEYNGDYTVKLEAKGFGAVDSTKQQITILNGKDYPPIPDFSFEDKGGGKYKFTNLSKNAISYSWSFGDGKGNSMEENPEYVFSENGEYNVKMEAKGKGGVATKDTVIKVTSSFTYYTYNLENMTPYTLFAYNNIEGTPNNNFTEVRLSSGAKITVRTKSKDGLIPFFKHNESTDLKLEVSSLNLKDYIVTGYINFYEIRLTGTCEPVTFTSNINGANEKKENVELPSIISTKSQNSEILELNAEKNNVNGYLTIQVYLKEELISTVTTSDPFGSVKLSLNSKTRKVTTSKFAPEEWPCGSYNGRRLITGPKGGCYYINSNNNKTYVDRSYCHCN